MKMKMQMKMKIEEGEGYKRERDACQVVARARREKGVICCGRSRGRAGLGLRKAFYARSSAASSSTSSRPLSFWYSLLIWRMKSRGACPFCMRSNILVILLDLEDGENQKYNVPRTSATSHHGCRPARH